MKDRQHHDFRVAATVRVAAQRFLYIGLVLGAFALMLLGKADTVLVEKLRARATDAVTPVLDVLSRPTASVSNVIDQGRELLEIHAENRRLKSENARLLEWEAAARKLAAENRVLSKLLHRVPDSKVEFITARVVWDAGGAFARSLILAAGARDGVTKGQAVTTGFGLVGRIHDVGYRSSRVLLITDINSRIPVVVETSRVRAIMAGNNEEQCRLILLPPEVDVNPGERIVTSGHAGVFPPGLPVGVVSSVSEAGILVQPLMERHRLEFVQVVDYGLSGILTAPGNVPGETSQGSR